MQRFWAGFGGFYQNGKIAKIGSKPLHGMGLRSVLAILAKMTKTRCVSALRLLAIVRYAASFGWFDKKLAKTRCVSDNLSQLVPTLVGGVRLATSFGADPFRHGLRVKSGIWVSPGISCQTHSEFWGFSGIFIWDSLRVWLKSRDRRDWDWMDCIPPVALPRRALKARACAALVARPGNVWRFAPNHASDGLERSRAAFSLAGSLRARLRCARFQTRSEFWDKIQNSLRV